MANIDKTSSNKRYLVKIDWYSPRRAAKVRQNANLAEYLDAYSEGIGDERRNARRNR